MKITQTQKFQNIVSDYFKKAETDVVHIPVSKFADEFGDVDMYKIGMAIGGMKGYLRIFTYIKNVIKVTKIDNKKEC
jgi:hypothetical protein